jgi:ABC-type transport system substrate-binding protein
MNNKLAPFDNPKVRQAVVMAFDRNAINAALNGLCAPINQAFPPGFDGYIASQKPKQNLAAAKKLIKEAGADGATIKAVAGTGASPYDTLNQIVQSQLQAIGLKVELVPTTPSLLRAAWRTGQYQALSNIALVPTIPDSSSVVANYALGVENPGTKDPALVELNNAAKVQPLGSKARDTAYRKITTYLNDNPIWAPLCSTYFLQVGTKEIQGIPDMPFRHQTNGPDLRSIWISKKK